MAAKAKAEEFTSCSVVSTGPEEVLGSWRVFWSMLLLTPDEAELSLLARLVAIVLIISSEAMADGVVG